MPDQVLKTLQADGERVRKAVESADADIAARKAALTAAKAELTAARLHGDAQAAARAEQTLNAAPRELEQLIDRRTGVAAHLDGILDRIFARELSAPAEVPLLMLPIRLEARFSADRSTLRIRIFPDDIHVDGLDRGLTSEETAAGQRYWIALWKDGDAALDAAWSALTNAVGESRAMWVAHALTPLNIANHGAAATPEFPAPSAPGDHVARVRLLPEYFQVRALCGDKELSAQGARVAAEVRIGLLSRDDAPLVEHHGLQIVDGTQWLSDYELAKQMGLAVDLPLQGNARVDRLFVFGVVQSRSPTETAGAFSSLLESHWATRGLAFVPQGTATNNTEADSAGWQRRVDPRPVPLMAAELPAQSNAALLQSTLGVGARWLGGLPHAQDCEQAAAQAMNAALWPATWGYFLDTLNQGDNDLSSVTVDNVRGFHEDHVRGRGPLPALRIGDQPYGVLPVTATSLLQGNDPFETQLIELLQRILPNWRAGIASLPHIGKATGIGDGIPDYMKLTPVSYGVRARRCLSGNMREMIGTTTDAGKDATVTEAYLAQLIDEALGHFNYVYGPAALDEKARPVMLPYADPDRDAGVLKALLAGTAPGPVSSVFQALAALAWDHVKAESKGGPRVNDVVRGTSTLPVALSNRVLGAVSDASVTSRGEVTQLLAALPGADDPKARPSVRSVQVLEAERGSLWESALNATSVEERDHLGVLFIDGVLRGQLRRTSVVDGFNTLIAEAERGAPDFSCLVAETLDTASHRLDAWLTGVAHRRLTAKPAAGITVGAFGWLEDLAQRANKQGDGGFLAAPGLPQAITAGILRSAYLSHDAKGGADSAFATDLSSRRVRNALYLLQGVREGQPLSALLGYRFERQLHEANCDRFVLSLRGMAPLQSRADVDGELKTDAEQTIAASNVLDMVKFVELWQRDGAQKIFLRLAERPKGNDFLDANVPWPAPTAAEQKAIAGAVTQAVEDIDSVADLLLAEAVHQMASGNPRRASVAMDAAGRGDVAPPEPDFISSRGPSAMLTHRMIAVLPAAGGWSMSAPRALAAPKLEAWAGRRLGAAQKIVVTKAGDRRRTLADAGIAALDFVYLATEPTVLERFVRARLDDQDAPLLAAGAPGLAGEEIPYGDALLLAQSLGALLATSKPADPLSFGLPSTPGFRPADGSIAAAKERLSTVLGVLGHDLEQLDALLAAAAVSQEALEKALTELAEFGLLLPSAQGRAGAELAQFVSAEGQRRVKVARALLDAGPTRGDQLDEIAKAIFGREFVLPIAFLFDPTVSPDALLGRQAITPPKPASVSRFVADWAAVRPALAIWLKAQLLGRSLGRPITPVVEQLRGRGAMEHDTWLGEGLAKDRPTPTAPVVSLIAEATDGLDLNAPLEALLIDDWTELLPERVRRGAADDAAVDARVTAGVALQADAPNAQPPQTLLLAVSPDGADWTADRVVKLLSDTLELARIRLVTLENLPLAARALPALYTQSWSLQGESFPDWQKVVVNDIASVTTVAGIKNFAMVKED